MQLSVSRLALLLVIVAIPMFVWGTVTQNLETRQFAAENDTITPSPTPSSTPTPTSVPNVEPTCSGLSTIPANGTVPLSVSFSCAGNDTDNDITAAEFDFGEGNKLLVEKGIGQFGSITSTYRYTTPGTYTVTCRVRDNNQKFSSIPDQCKKIISVKARPTAAPTKVAIPTSDIIVYTGPTATPTATLAPVPTNTTIPTPTPPPVAQDNSKLWQLGQILLISIGTIVIGLFLRRLIGGSD